MMGAGRKRCVRTCHSSKEAILLSISGGGIAKGGFVAPGISHGAPRPSSSSLSNSMVPSTRPFSASVLITLRVDAQLCVSPPKAQCWALRRFLRKRSYANSLRIPNSAERVLFFRLVFDGRVEIIFFPVVSHYFYLVLERRCLGYVVVISTGVLFTLRICDRARYAARPPGRCELDPFCRVEFISFRLQFPCD